MPITTETNTTAPVSKLDGAYQLQGLERAVSVLEMLSDCEIPLSLADICRRTQMHKSTVHRSLMVLERSGLIERTPEDRFRLGLKLYDLGSRAVEQVDLRMRIRPYFRQLSAQVGHTVHLGVLHNTSVLYLDKAEPNRRICLSSKTGGANPVYCTSMGKAMLAFLPPASAEEIIQRIQFVRYTDRTITSREELDRALNHARQRGYSVDDEEIEIGVRCVGAPIFDQNRIPIAAVSISGPSIRLRPQDVPATAALLMRCCADISRSLLAHGKKRSHIAVPSP